MRLLLQRLLRDEQGQDLIEYALLTAGIGIVGVAVWPAIIEAVGDAYAGYDRAAQQLWRVPDPRD